MANYEQEFKQPRLEEEEEEAPGSPLSNHEEDNAAPTGGSGEVEHDAEKGKRGFIINLYEMTMNPEYESCIGFTSDGLSLELRDGTRLSEEILPLYFKHGNVSSFVRQLNNYGFRTKPSGTGVFQTFTHEHFQSGRPELLEKVTRRAGAKRVKKKSLHEQVAELREREVESAQRLEDLMTQVRSLKEQNDALMKENKRLHSAMKHPGGGNSAIYTAGGHQPMPYPTSYQHPHAQQGNQLFFQQMPQQLAGQSGQSRGAPLSPSNIHGMYSSMPQHQQQQQQQQQHPHQSKKAGAPGQQNPGNVHPSAQPKGGGQNPFPIDLFTDFASHPDFDSIL